MKLELLFHINLSIVLLIAFIATKKKLTILENIFMILLLEFILSSYYAVLYVNLGLWEVSKESGLYACFVLYEIAVVPIVYMFYYNKVVFMKSVWIKMTFTIVTIGAIYIAEVLLIYMGVVTYKSWYMWQSLVGIFLLIVLFGFILYGFQLLLKWEGVIKHDAT